MVVQNDQSYETSFLGEVGIRIRDNEERQRMLKERMLLIGKNVIEMREHVQIELVELKKSVQETQEEMKKIKSLLRNITLDLEKFAKKSEVEVLTKQARMFQPLELVTKEELQAMFTKGEKN